MFLKSLLREFQAFKAWNSLKILLEQYQKMYKSQIYTFFDIGLFLSKDHSFLLLYVYMNV